MTTRVLRFAAAFLLFASPVAARESNGTAQTTAASGPQDALSKALEQGKSAYETGNFVGAVDQYNQVLQNYPSLPEAVFYRGRAYEALRRFSEAERDFTTYCRLMPDVMAGYLERGRVRRASGRLKSALVDFTLIIGHKIPYNYGNLDPVTQEDLSGEACLERATTQYQIGLSSEMSGRGRAAAFETALADFDRGLANGRLRVEVTPNAVFNRAFVAEAQATDPLASSPDAAEARYETVAAGYEAYLQYAPKAPDARAVRNHVTQIFAWLSGDKTAPRPTASSTFALKPYP